MCRDYETDALKRYIPPPIWVNWNPKSALRQPLQGRRRELLSLEIRRWKAATVAAHRLGVPMLAGTDCGANNNHMIPGWSMHEELEELVTIGLTSIDVLRMATLNSAEWRNRSAFEGVSIVGNWPTSSC